MVAEERRVRQVEELAIRQRCKVCWPRSSMPQHASEKSRTSKTVSWCLLLVEHGSHCVGHDQWTNLFALLGWRHKISKKCNGRISDSGRSLSLQRDRMWLIVIIYSPGFAWIFLLILISSCTSRTWCHMNLIWASFCPRTSGPEMCTVGMSSLKMFEGVVLLLLLSCAPPLHQRTAKKKNDHLPSYSASEDTRVRYIGQRSVGHICPLISWWGQCISAKAGRGRTA